MNSPLFLQSCLIPGGEQDSRKGYQEIEKLLHSSSGEIIACYRAFLPLSHEWVLVLMGFSPSKRLLGSIERILARIHARPTELSQEEIAPIIRQFLNRERQHSMTGETWFESHREHLPSVEGPPTQSSALPSKHLHLLSHCLAQALVQVCLYERRKTTHQRESDDFAQAHELLNTTTLFPDTPPEEEPSRVASVALLIWLFRLRTRILLDQDIPELVGLADLLAGRRLDQHLEIAHGFARRWLQEGHCAKWYPLPPTLTYTDLVWEFTMSLSIFVVCHDYPNIRGLDQSAREDRLEKASHHFPLITPLLAQKSTRTTLLQLWERMYGTWITFLQQAPEIGTHAAFLVHQAPTPLDGVVRVIAWLVQRSGLDHHRIASITKPSPLTMFLSNATSTAAQQPCVIGSCSRAASPVLEMQIPCQQMTCRAVVWACQRHRASVIQSYRGEKGRALAEQIAQAQEQTVCGPPHILPLCNSTQGRPDPLKTNLLIERYRLQQQLMVDKSLAHVLDQLGGARVRLFADAYIDAALDLAHKYTLAASAIGMITYLPARSLDQAIERAIMWHPHVWMKLEEPLPTPYGTLHGFAFTTGHAQKIEWAQQRYPLSPQMLERVRSLFLPRAGSSVYCLDAFNERGEIIWSVICQRHQVQGQPQHVWLLPAWARLCTDPTCGDQQTCCSLCSTIVEYYFGLYTNALSLIAGELSEQEDSPTFPTRKEQAVRKERDPGKIHKFRERTVEHTFSVVSFNAAVKHAPREPQASSIPGISHGSWMARVDPNAIVWVDHHFTNLTRRLRHPRYRHYIERHGGNPDDPAGFVIPVADHRRRTAMKLETLRRRLTHVTFEPPQAHS